ncbi:MAG: hypothetical protein KDD40_09295 [Bdellovibrionales bacterium]|nr:hypothetical protein [Bdellovibrionales bacterium]
MKSLWIVWFILSASSVNAHECDYTIEILQQKYCLGLEWQKAQNKKLSQWQDSEFMSPQLVRQRTPAKKKMYSSAHIKVWELSDELQANLKIDGFHVFPFMEMVDGHGHFSTYNFFWDENLQVYVLNQLNLSEMKGCWNLRWSIEQGDLLNTSHWLMSVEQYENINSAEYMQIMSWCSMCRSQSPSEHVH